MSDTRYPSYRTYPGIYPNDRGLNMRKILRQPDIEELLADLGLKRKQARIGAAIALCEAPAGMSADGYPQADFGAIGDQTLADEVWGYSYGGFQIRSLRAQKGTGGIRDEDELLRPRFNCRSAIAIKRAGGGWDAWTTYTSGAFKAYLQDIYPPPPNTYVVVAGDSLSTIASKLSGGAWTWETLAELNQIVYPYTIYIGQHLKLP